MREFPGHRHSLWDWDWTGVRDDGAGPPGVGLRPAQPQQGGHVRPGLRGGQGEGPGRSVRQESYHPQRDETCMSQIEH